MPAGKSKKILDIDFAGLKKSAFEIEQTLMKQINDMKGLLSNLRAEIKDTRLSVVVNEKGEIEINFNLAAVLKKK